MKKNSSEDVQGSIQWAGNSIPSRLVIARDSYCCCLFTSTIFRLLDLAPEILADSEGADLPLANIYSFGIILWELLTRSQPYPDLRCAIIS